MPATAELFGSRLLCRACGEPVTSETEAVPVGGSSVHRRTNPAGIEFEFGCFRDAPGALAVGQPTIEYTWFAGYAWSYALCLGCGEHLGWHFEGGEVAFYGLILSRLRPESAQPARPS